MLQPWARLYLLHCWLDLMASLPLSTVVQNQGVGERYFTSMEYSFHVYMMQIVLGK